MLMQKAGIMAGSWRRFFSILEKPRATGEEDPRFKGYRSPGFLSTLKMEQSRF